MTSHEHSSSFRIVVLGKRDTARCEASTLEKGLAKGRNLEDTIPAPNPTKLEAVDTLEDVLFVHEWHDDRNLRRSQRAQRAALLYAREKLRISDKVDEEEEEQTYVRIEQASSPNHSLTPNCGIGYCAYPLHLRVRPGTCLSVVASAWLSVEDPRRPEDPLNGNAEIDADKDGGWDVYANQELRAGHEIVLGWEWNDAHSIHGGEEGRLEAVDALEGAFMTCACDGRIGCALEDAGREAERIQHQGQGARWHRDRTGKGKAEAKGGAEGGITGEEHDGTSRRSTTEDEERPRKNANLAVAIKPNRHFTTAGAKEKPPCSTSDAMSAASFDVMTLDSPSTAASSSDVPHV
ncbi:hypothetical protein ARMSODRAFT_977525 [Armillaria solidipes]|uniref:SET domain-containing protein n=1 Tax=Armillaria solidipes TaxID=1076256 RepID=A0A2H3BCJ4_9AGAR|nr:hypothetical protein ARMSODRAFT_977525 [Armillaria solidipes]